ncbi:uncharacterized protein LOC121081686 [Falco naumanni]|uniref:uncharacterized protein LOC121081686 n=1 Tax=Falco naumanni TaxID=148594 RepID=UPI001ADE8B52|nr:uncharacterized protein LOC121081686 [Falco naumanni]
MGYETAGQHILGQIFLHTFAATSQALSSQPEPPLTYISLVPVKSIDLFHDTQEEISSLTPAMHHSPAVPSAHHPSTASPPRSISGIRPQDFSDLPHCKFRMVPTPNQESDQIFLKMGPVSFKPCYKLQQSLGFDFLVKLETTCVPHGLGFCCEYLTQLYGNSLFLWAFSISYPSQNHKKQRLENMKTTITGKKGGLNFLNLRRLCSFRAQREVLN